jgi:hypothetical protein
LPGYRTLNRFVLGAVLLSLTSAPVAGAVSRLRLQDDRGKQIQGPVKVCLSRGLETTCLDEPPYLIPPSMRVFDSLTAEGPEHGPVHLITVDSKTTGSEEYTVSLPRKALLVVSGIPQEPMTLSLYSRDSDSFRKPSYRYERPAISRIRIPAQDFLMSLSEGQNAPDLQFLSAEPGKKYSISYHPRRGWSVLLRCLSSGTRKPVAKATIVALSASIPGSERELGRSVTERDGLVAISGIAEAYATMSMSADGYLKRSVYGVKAGPGTFGFREELLERGGSIKAHVTLDGEPAVGASCRLVSTRSKREPGRRLPTSVVLSENRVGEDGTCTTPSFPQGDYIFRVIPKGAANGDDESIVIWEEQTRELEVKLRQIEVRGTVRRGEKPEVGAVVWIMNEEDAETSPSGRSAPPEILKAETDEDGHYRGHVWRLGKYDFTVANRADMAAASKSIEVGSDGVTVDFQLNDSDISGIVVDQDDKPVAEAWVNLEQPVSGGRQTRYGISDNSGQFHYSMEGAGPVRLLAGKKGYRKADPVDLNVSPDATVPPVTMAVTRLDSLDGQVVSATGSPMPGVRVATYQAVSGRAPDAAGDALTDADGQFSVPRALGPSSRVFVTGPGCPLQALDVVNDDEKKTFQCTPVSSGLEVTIKKADETPVQDEHVLFRWNGLLVPRVVLNSHLTLLGMPTGTDGSGRITIVALPPGDYDVFLMSGSSEATISGGLQYGFVSTVHLDPMTTVEVEAHVQF